MQMFQVKKRYRKTDGRMNGMSREVKELTERDGAVGSG
jgi:hypothetical protein